LTVGTATNIVDRLLETDEVSSDAQRYLGDLGDYTVKYLEFPVGNRAYGGGGWSRNARHRPAPEERTVKTKDVVFKGKSVIINGTQRRLKANVWDWQGKPVRIDYPDLKLGA